MRLTKKHIKAVEILIKKYKTVTQEELNIFSIITLFRDKNGCCYLCESTNPKGRLFRMKDCNKCIFSVNTKRNEWQELAFKLNVYEHYCIWQYSEGFRKIYVDRKVKIKSCRARARLLQRKLNQYYEQTKKSSK
jgi:hypothetical protein